MLADLIVDRQRTMIEKSLKNYEYHYALPVDSYDDLLLDYGGQPVRNMVVTTWRSGSTFLGQLVDSCSSPLLEVNTRSIIFILNELL